MNPLPQALVINGKAATSTLFRLFQKAHGDSVLTAETGEAGTRLVRDHLPGIVFTGLKMPGMDGFDVLERIEKTAPQTEVIAITGHGEMDHVLHALNLEAADFIDQPIGRSALDAGTSHLDISFDHTSPVNGAGRAG